MPCSLSAWLTFHLVCLSVEFAHALCTRIVEKLIVSQDFKERCVCSALLCLCSEQLLRL